MNITFSQSSSVHSAYSLAKANRFCIIAGVSFGFFSGRLQVNPISFHLLRNVMDDTVTPVSCNKSCICLRDLRRFSSVICSILLSLRAVVILFRPHLPTRCGDRVLFSFSFLLIFRTDDCETWTSSAICLWLYFSRVNRSLICEILAGDKSEALPIVETSGNKKKNNNKNNFFFLKYY